MKRLTRIIAAVLAALICASALVALAEGTITTTGSVHLRRGPGLDYRSICTIGSGTRLTYTKTAEDDRGVIWYRVTYDGNKGWVSSAYARKGSATVDQVTTTNSVHLRAGAGTEYASRTVVDAGTTLTYDRTAKSDDGGTWYHVTYRDKTGWISGRYVTRGSGGATGTITTTGSVNLRSGAGLDYASRMVIGMGVTLNYDRTSRDERGVTWYHVNYSGKSGWVSSRYVKKGSGGSSGSQVTTTGSVNIRSGPGLDYASRGTVGAGVTLTYDDTDRDERNVLWYHVNYNGTRGWISSKYTRSGGGSSEKRVYLTGSANIRSGPGLEYESIGTADEGTVLTYRGKSREDDRGVRWYAVVYKGKNGWVSSRYSKLK